MSKPRCVLERALIAIVAASPFIGVHSAPRAADVEIQVGLCTQFELIEQALDLRSRGAPLEVWLFDDSALALFGKGLRFRLRVIGNRSELTVKIAGQDCARLEPGLVPPKEGKCEYDLHGDTLAGAVSLTEQIGVKQTRRLLSDPRAMIDALSPAQVRYLRDVVNAWPLPADVRRLGPIEVRRYRSAARPYDVDVSLLADGSQFIEISRKVAYADVARLRAQLDADLSRAGIASCADQSAQAERKLLSLLATWPG